MRVVEMTVWALLRKEKALHKKGHYAFLKVSQSIPKSLTVARRVPIGTSLPP